MVPSHDMAYKSLYKLILCPISIYQSKNRVVILTHIGLPQFHLHHQKMYQKM